MSKSNLKYLRNEAIEEITANRIREYESKVGKAVNFPIPIEKIVEQVLSLTFDWDVIEEQPGEQILGGLVVEERKILLNVKHLSLFEAKPGLERSTIGHEAGHWDIDIDRTTLNHPSFPGLPAQSSIIHRHTKNSEWSVKILNLAFGDERYYRVYEKLTEGQDSPEVRSAVDRYQSALLMPKWLVIEAEGHYDFTKWSDLYNLAQQAQVNISNLTVRLQRLNLIFIPENSKDIFRSRDQYIGQGTLF
jgi:hypothetical protein